MHDRRVDLGCPCCVQVLGRNLEALVTRAQEVKADWKDEYVSVEHMLLAFVDDTKFGREVIFNKSSDLDRAKLEAAVKDIRGTNRVTDQVSRAVYFLLLFVQVCYPMQICPAINRSVVSVSMPVLHGSCAAVSARPCFICLHC